MKNYVQPGQTIPVTNLTSYPIESGALVVIGALIGVASGAIDPAADGEIDTEGVFELPKVSVDDIDAGELLYYAVATANLTNTPGTDSKPLVGAATKAAGAGVLVVNCKLGVHGITGPAE